MPELYFCDRSIRRTVYSNDLVKLAMSFWLRLICDQASFFFVAGKNRAPGRKLGCDV